MNKIVSMIGVIVIGITLSSYKEHQGDTMRRKPINKCRKLLDRKIERMSTQIV